MKVTAKVSGLKELEAALMGLDKASTRKTVARNALKKAGAPVADRANEMAPVGATRRLKGSVIVSTKIVGEAGKAAYAKTMRATAGNKALATKAMRDARRAAKGTMPPVMMFVGPVKTVFYSHLVEFGTAPHINGGIFAGSKHPGTRPQPFMRPAWDAMQDVALARITDELRGQIMRAASRQAKRKAKANG